MSFSKTGSSCTQQTRLLLNFGTFWIPLWKVRKSHKHSSCSHILQKVIIIIGAAVPDPELFMRFDIPCCLVRTRVNAAAMYRGSPTYTKSTLFSCIHLYNQHHPDRARRQHSHILRILNFQIKDTVRRYLTLLIAELLSGKNARAWVSMDFT